MKFDFFSVKFSIKKISTNNCGAAFRICGGSGCNDDSLCGQVKIATTYDNRSYVAAVVTSWLDDYFDWLRPTASCCDFFKDNGTFCPSTSKKTRKQVWRSRFGKEKFLFFFQIFRICKIFFLHDQIREKKRRKVFRIFEKLQKALISSVRSRERMGISRHFSRTNLCGFL